MKSIISKALNTQYVLQSTDVLDPNLTLDQILEIAHTRPEVLNNLTLEFFNRTDPEKVVEVYRSVVRHYVYAEQRDRPEQSKPYFIWSVADRVINLTNCDVDRANWLKVQVSFRSYAVHVDLLLQFLGQWGELNLLDAAKTLERICREESEKELGKNVVPIFSIHQERKQDLSLHSGLSLPDALPESYYLTRELDSNEHLTTSHWPAYPGSFPFVDASYSKSTTHH